VNRIAFGRHAELLGADPRERTNVARFEFVFANDSALRFHHHVHCERDVHAQNFGAVEQALRVFLQAENRRALVGLVSADALKRAAAVVQGVRQHMDRGVAPFHHLAVHPDFSVAICH
jgi:hypothetical protein